jgi:hypothetical protein
MSMKKKSLHYQRRNEKNISWKYSVKYGKIKICIEEIYNLAKLTVFFLIIPCMGLIIYNPLLDVIH